MRVLRRIWGDIGRGENIDLYLLVGAVVALFLLDLFGVDVQSSLASATVAILGLLAVAMLVNRRRMEDLAQVSLGGERTILRDFPSELASDLDRAREVWLTGIHPNTTFHTYSSTLEKKLRRGDSLRVLVVDPNGAACEMAAMRISVQMNADDIRARVTSFLNTLCELRNMAPDRLKIRTIDYLLEYGALVLDPDSASGVIYVRRYSFKSAGGAVKPKLVYHRKDGSWYDLICAEVRALWESGTPWECQ
jgi:hypothetical protein